MRPFRSYPSPAFALFAVLAVALPQSVTARAAPDRAAGNPADSPQTPTLRRMFVTSATGTGDLSTWAASGNQDGIVGANQVCQTLAETAGLATAGDPLFRAWISDAANDAWCNIQGLSGQKTGASPCGGGTQIAVGPWVRTDGLLFADSLTQLAGPALFVYVPAVIDETASEVLTATLFMTGTFAAGTSSTANCTQWTTTVGQDQPGSSRATVTWGSSGSLSPCSTLQRLACFEVGVGIAVAKPSAPGHLAFISSVAGTGDLSSWPDAGGASGIDAGDAICQARATAARIPAPESFHAWLSDTAHDAACRARGLSGLVSNNCDGGVAPPDAPYRRIDGFALAANFAGLLDDLLETSPSIDELGNQHSNNLVYTGTSANGTLEPSNGSCSDWTSAASTAAIGTTNLTTGAWTSTGGALCSNNRPIYCFSTAITIFWDGFESGTFARWSVAVGGS